MRVWGEPRSEGLCRAAGMQIEKNDISEHTCRMLGLGATRPPMKGLSSGGSRPSSCSGGRGACTTHLCGVANSDKQAVGMAQAS